MVSGQHRIHPDRFGVDWSHLQPFELRPAPRILSGYLLPPTPNPVLGLKRLLPPPQSENLRLYWNDNRTVRACWQQRSRWCQWRRDPSRLIPSPRSNDMPCPQPWHVLGVNIQPWLDQKHPQQHIVLAQAAQDNPDLQD